MKIDIQSNQTIDRIIEIFQKWNTNSNILVRNNGTSILFLSYWISRQEPDIEPCWSNKNIYQLIISRSDVHNKRELGDQNIQIKVHYQWICRDQIRTGLGLPFSPLLKETQNMFETQLHVDQRNRNRIESGGIEAIWKDLQIVWGFEWVHYNDSIR